MLEAGQKAPEFEVEDHQGNLVRLSDFQGKNLVLWFYPKADTPGWTKEGRGFRDKLQLFQDKNAAIVGASFDTREENRAFAAKFDFPFPLLCDTSRALGLAYGACDREDASHAKRISYVIGPDGVIVKAYPDVDAATHAEGVLSDL